MIDYGLLRNRFFLSIFLLLFTFSGGLMAQNQLGTNTLTLEIAGYEKDKLLWAALYGDDLNIIDTIRGSESKFEYQIPAGTLSGVYRLLFDEGEKQLDVVYHNEDIHVYTHYEAILNNLVIIKSDATRRYHRFMRARGYVNYKQRTLNDFLSRYPESDPFYEEARLQYLHLSEELNDSVDVIIANDRFLARLLANEKEPVPEKLLSDKEYDEFMKARFFAGKDYGDPLILRSQLFPEQLLSYLGYYRNPEFTEEQQEAAFATAVDSIIKYTRENPEVFDFTINYLIEGFKRFGFDELVNHIAERTASEINCINEERREEMQEKLTRIQSTAIGAKAPALVMENMKGKEVALHNIESEKILLVFWASWCPHCMEMLPKLKKFTMESPEMAVVAVSLDDEKAQWKKAASGYNWIHLSSLKGWETQAVDDYFVYGTPSFFLLDTDKTILNKSGTLQEVIEFMEAR
jgi:thiol-disulfide isomerase/thioredoxin